MALLTTISLYFRPPENEDDEKEKSTPDLGMLVLGSKTPLVEIWGDTPRLDSKGHSLALWRDLE